MSLRLLLCESPSRAFALATETHALIFRHSPAASAATGPSNGGGSKPVSSKGMVEFTPIDQVDLSDYRVVRPSGIHGTLGLINIDADVFLCLITGAIRTATIRPGETVQRIVSVEFHCMNRNDFDTAARDDFDPYSREIYASNGQDFTHGEPEFVHPCQELKKMLSSGTFYYSTDCDLTNRLQDRISDESVFNVDTLDEGFLWNSYMIAPVVAFRSRLRTSEKKILDASRILTSAIRGFVSTITIPASSSPVKPGETSLPSTLTIISRLSCRRAGTRFNARGIDDNGNVANFVETESVVWHPSGLCFSYAQIRGSVPIFWEQAAGLLPGQQKIQITRSPEATQPAFDKHFESLELKYGTIHILNLLSDSRIGEVELTGRYKLHVQHSPFNQEIDLSGTAENKLLDSQFDFHAETRGSGGYEAANMIRHLIADRVDGFAYFLSESLDSHPTSHSPTSVNLILQQQGVFRTNCLDCLDRTNLIQTIVSQMAIELFLRHRRERALSDFWVRHSSLWADNGDALSKIYAGTGALKSSFTRHGKMSLAGALADARKSATRMYINNFADKDRQKSIDMLLGRLIDQVPVQLYDPVTDFVNAELKRRINEYSSSTSLSIWVGTFNLNGRAEGAKSDLTAWLCPQVLTTSADIYAVGFQEMVELSPQQIMSTDPMRRQAWEDCVSRTLNKKALQGSEDKYILLRSGQLVGAALMVFVKSSLLKKIKNVEGSVKKTGMSGMAGNKGAVAIRMDFANTGLCFVTAHLAAGFANYEERNRDYRTITHGLHFQRNRSIEDHDTIIWLGDFNYRIGLGDEKVRRMIGAGDLDTLYSNDQLNLQMVAGNVFKYYSEARITFKPTYKYDNGTDTYDTSEKTRIPAWTDRILRRGDLRQTSYNTAPLRFSDHRPVYGTFQCTVSDIDESKKERLSQEIYGRRRADVGDAVAHAKDEEGLDDEDLIGFDAISPELPPASSDRRKWWLDNGLPARSGVKPTNEAALLNSRRPLNPFTPTNEPDWKLNNKASPSVARKDTSARRTATPQRSSDENRSEPPQLPTRPNANSSMAPETERSFKRSPPIDPRPRTSSQLSNASTGSTVSRKPAPPIPEKPLVLSRTGERHQSIGSSTNKGEMKQLTGSRNAPLSPVKPNIGALPAKPSLPAASAANIRPSKSSSGQSSPNALAFQAQALASEAQRPSPPPRRNTNNRAPTGLMDEDISGGSSIPSLKPMPQR